MGMKPGVPLRRGLNPSSSAPYSSSSSTRRSSPLPIQPSSTLSCNLSCSPSSSSSSCTSSSPTSSPILSPRSPTSTIISFGEEEADICSIKSKFMKCIECNLWYCEFCQQSGISSFFSSLSISLFLQILISFSSSFFQRNLSNGFKTFLEES